MVNESNTDSNGGFDICVANITPTGKELSVSSSMRRKTDVVKGKLITIPATTTQIERE